MNDTTDLPALPEPYKDAVYATLANTASVRKGHEMSGYEKTPALFTADQMLAFRAEAIAARDAEIARLSAALAAQQPAAVQITDDMARAYLAANTAYWRAVDESVGKPGVWRNGTPHEATLEGLRAALAAAPAVQPSERVPLSSLRGIAAMPSGETSESIVQKAWEQPAEAVAQGPWQLTRSIIHNCPALRVPQTWLQRLGNVAQIVVLKGADEALAQSIADALNVAPAAAPSAQPGALGVAVNRALFRPECQRLSEWALIGPVQRAAVESFAEALLAAAPSAPQKGDAE